MADEQPQMSQEEIIAQQKANCPFCKIVAGEITAYKVYEDDIILAIMDINPATKGHILVMPKEHYPIMPLIPPEVFSHLFEKLKFISKGQKEITLTDKNLWFIANGGAAGQRSSHFMLHLIPREEKDGLENVFDLKPTTNEDAQVSELAKVLSQNLKIALKEFNPQSPESGQKDLGTINPPSNATPPKTDSPSSPTVSDAQKKLLAKRLEDDGELRDLVIKNPEDAQKKIAGDEELRKLFDGVDVTTLSKKLGAVYGQQESENKQPAPAPVPATPAPPPAATTSAPTKTDGEKKKLADELENNRELRELLINAPDKLQEQIKTDAKLAELFKNVDIASLSTKLRIAYGGSK
jgi:histidine triad (HIT) family protein